MTFDQSHDTTLGSKEHCATFGWNLSLGISITRWKGKVGLPGRRQTKWSLCDTMHLLPSLEGDMKICSTYYQGNMHCIEVLHTLAFHSKGVRLGVQIKPVLWRHNPCRCSAVPWDMTGRHDVWRETQRFVLPPRDFSRQIIFLYLSYYFYEV